MNDQTSAAIAAHSKATYESLLPVHRDLYYGGAWHKPEGGYVDTINPATGQSLGPTADANKDDVNAAVLAAQAGYKLWQKFKPSERATVMRKIAQILRDNADDLAMIDAANCGNPITEMMNDARVAAAMIEYYAGLATEIKGQTIPMGEGVVNMTVLEPYGVVARIVAYNHPIQFTAGKMGAALAAGNAVIMKPPHQAPLSSYRMMELIDGIAPPGVINIISCGLAGSDAIVRHPDIPRVSLIGSVPTGRAIAKAGAERLKHVTLELGGKNACIIYPDADIEKAARAAIDGMNFTWCGQSCGSTSRLFVHESIYDKVVKLAIERIRYYVPGIPTKAETTMGSLISKIQFDKVMNYIDIATKEGATLLYGGKRPVEDELSNGFYVEPTVFTDVTQDMRIANEEVFGPVLAILKWSDEDDMLEQVNRVEYGLTGTIWTSSLRNAHYAASKVQSGYIWVNRAGVHFLGAPFGGFKQSGLGREGQAEEMHSFSQLKNININF